MKDEYGDESQSYLRINEPNDIESDKELAK